MPSFDHLPRSEFIIDVKVCSMVSANGDWKSRWNPDRTKFLNPSLAQKEQSKDTKHASNYAKIGYGFLPFVLGSFGGIGNSAARFLQALAFCETQQNDDLRAKTGLPLLILLIDLNFVLSVFGIAPPASLLLLLRPLSCDLLGPLIFLHLPMLLLLIWLTIVLVLLLSFRAGVLLPALPLLALLLPALLLSLIHI